MIWFFLVFVIFTQSIVLYACIFSSYTKSHNSIITKTRQISSSSINPFISVILPIKTIDSSHLTIIQQLSKQNYPNYEVIIIYEDEKLVGIPEYLSKIRFIKNNPHFTGFRSNKVSNMLFGIKNTNPCSDILIFVDDDILINDNFLNVFQKYLEIYPESVVTSLRHINEAVCIQDHILLLINNTLATLMILKRWRCVWGGCFGFWRTLNEIINVEEAWSNSISDDLDLTKHLQQLNIPIVVSQEFLCISNQFVRGYSNLFRWGVRQFRLARFYASHNYIDSIIISVAFLLSYILTLALLIYQTHIGAIAITAQLYTMYILLMHFRQLDVRLSRRRSILILPLLPAMILVTATAALLGGSIEWKGQQYLLKRHHGQTLL